MRIQLSDKQRQEIAEVAEQLKAGTLRQGVMNHRKGAEALVYQLYQAQYSLRGWRSHPPRQRGYRMMPDCAKALLLECRAIRQVFKQAGIKLTPYRD